MTDARATGAGMFLLRTVKLHPAPGRHGLMLDAGAHLTVANHVRNGLPAPAHAKALRDAGVFSKERVVKIERENALTLLLAAGRQSGTDKSTRPIAEQSAK